MWESFNKVQALKPDCLIQFFLTETKKRLHKKLLKSKRMLPIPSQSHFESLSSNQFESMSQYLKRGLCQNQFASLNQNMIMCQFESLNLNLNQGRLDRSLWSACGPYLKDPRKKTFYKSKRELWNTPGQLSSHTSCLVWDVCANFHCRLRAK